jgi:hypothetical protein
MKISAISFQELNGPQHKVGTFGCFQIFYFLV